ncbi:sphingosine N-acyltransferase lag1 [Marasmius crinis-equi]|uniref:Sphingosine N-acyltransferase lag1 n=1 Tax=Marasmius crinis-equi TaxID=585013 RepID=A0ABR3FAX7_9AGAR
MAQSTARRRHVRNVPPDIDTGIEQDPAHHLTGPFLPQTPLGTPTPARTPSPGARIPSKPRVSPWIRWAIDPPFRILVVPIAGYLNWELLTPFLGLSSEQLPNPFAPFFLLSNPVSSSTPSDPRYAKSWGDLAFIGYHIVFFSLVRQFVTITTCHPIARYFGIRSEAKLARFGEQGYALVYFAVMGAWGYRVMSQLPTFCPSVSLNLLHFRRTDYPHWDMKPELKRYYLTHMSYWAQQLLVMVLNLEKPRKDYWELVAHHIVTIWLVSWSYLMNLTLIGNAVYMSMDIPDAFFAFAKLLNYIQWNNAKVVAFLVFVGVWSYFRHYLNFRILWSVWYEYDLIPETSKQWDWEQGTYLAGWMKYQVFIPLSLLQLLNLFWYYLILRILVRAVAAPTAIDDDRSDDEAD